MKPFYSLLASERARNLVRFGTISFMFIWLGCCAFRLWEPMHEGRFFSYKGPHNEIETNDWVRLYVAGRLAQSVESREIYNPRIQLAMYNLVLNPVHVSKNYFIELPPSDFPLMIPFACLPLRTSFAAWTALSILAATTFTTLFLTRCRHFSTSTALLILLAALISLPGLTSIRVGQTTIFAVASLLMFLVGYCKNKPMVAAAGLVMSFVKPQFGIFYLVACIGAGRWKIVMAFMVMLLAGLLICGQTIGFENTFLWPKIVSENESITLSNVSPDTMCSVRSFIYFLAPHGADLRLSYYAFLCGLLATAVLAFTIRKSESLEKTLVMFGAVGFLSVLVSPHMNVYDVLFASIPVLSTIRSASLIDIVRERSMPSRMLNSAYWLYPSITWLLGLNPLFNCSYAVFNAVLFGLNVKQLMAVNQVEPKAT